VDLDNDGDLDLVINNIDQDAFILRNDSPPGHWLTLQLEGDPKNPEGIGAKAIVYTRQTRQLLELYPVRGFESSVDPRLHFGFGATTPDSLTVIWPDDRRQTIRHPKTDTILRIQYNNASPVSPLPAPPAPPPRRQTPFHRRHPHPRPWLPSPRDLVLRLRISTLIAPAIFPGRPLHQRG